MSREGVGPPRHRASAFLDEAGGGQPPEVQTQLRIGKTREGLGKIVPVNPPPNKEQAIDDGLSVG